jgi:hypothetical protein
MNLDGSSRRVLFPAELDCEDWMALWWIIIANPFSMSKAFNCSPREKMTEVFERDVSKVELSATAGTGEGHLRPFGENEVEVTVRD